MSDPLVSIVLPTYNGSRHIAQSIESCLNQTYRELEIIVVDDASTDDTPAIVDGFLRKDGRVRCIRHPVNRKLPAALNSGFAHCRGKLQTWTSDDNFYTPDAIAAMAEALNSNAGVDIVYANQTIVDEAGAEVGPWNNGPIHHLIYRNCIGGCFLFRQAVCRDVGGYNEESFLVEDYEFWLRASLRHRFTHLERPLYFYREHPGSLTAQHAAAIHDAKSKLQMRMIGRLHWLDRHIRGRRLLELTRFGREKNDKALVLECLLGALPNAPLAVLRYAVCVLAGRLPPELADSTDPKHPEGRV